MASGAVVAGEVVMAVVQTTQHARSTGLNIKQAQSTANCDLPIVSWDPLEC